MVMLICGTVVIQLTWSENTGDAKVEVMEGLSAAWTNLVSDKKIWLVGISQSLFEGSMYTFVFMWTPQLEETNITGAKLPYGTVFACFMVSCMIGSTCVGILGRWKPAREYMVYIFLLAAFALFPSAAGMGFMSQLFGFCLFEGCVGVYFPTWGSLRSEVVPEECRSAIMNLFRVPLNFIVVIILINIDTLSGSTVFSLCFIGLLASGVCQLLLSQKMAAAEPEDSKAETQELVENDAEIALDILGLGDSPHET